MSKRHQYRELPDMELPLDLDEEVRAMIQVAERDVAERRARGQLRPVLAGQASAERARDETAKEHLRRLVEDFLPTHPETTRLATTFAARWEELKRRPLAVLAAHEGRPATADGVAGSASGEDSLVEVISLMGWALLNRATGEAIAQEGEARGVPRALARALAGYLEDRSQGLDQAN